MSIAISGQQPSGRLLRARAVVGYSGPVGAM
ncbi:hypothetical protein FB385_0769 [Paramicrobacterium agarici]|uniref:Uncharacterized protein n=1 Tax=Paramicrobacterium agarici TaxID=630514 RepID=A0A2A9DZN9_9MICO|nr:hypothetical protein ATJ78_3047 [Microbacterium agarici]TQO21956.1 hypothetical protein FB385_0769 [Microbacterium agarici]